MRVYGISNKIIIDFKFEVLENFVKKLLQQIRTKYIYSAHSSNGCYRKSTNPSQDVMDFFVEFFKKKIKYRKTPGKSGRCRLFEFFFCFSVRDIPVPYAKKQVKIQF